jgi:type IV secretion system protein VirB10
MSQHEFTTPAQPQPEPELRRAETQPKGVLQKNLKTFVYLGAALLVILAAIFSSSAKKTTGHEAAQKGQPPQPTLQDNTDNNVQDLKSQLQAERQKEQQQVGTPPGEDPTLPSATAAQQTAGASYGQTGVVAPCMPGQPCLQIQPGNGQGNNGQPQLSPVEQQAQEIAARERARVDESRFASNLVYARLQEQSHQQAAYLSIPAQHDPVAPPQAETSLVGGRTPGDQPGEAPAHKRPLEANVDSAVGQPYLIYEGAVLDTVLMNRLDGDAAGPVKALVSNPFYSHDHQHVLIPEGTVVLGEAKKIGAAGFGQQRRIAIVFHRMIMPDGYSVDLDQFDGLDQIGEEGIKDRVNNHYLEIFGTSIALGVLAGAGEIEGGGGTISTSGSEAFTTGAASSVSQSATSILDRFLQIPPTITIREGHRVKVYFTRDMLLPAYSNHTIPQTF